MTQFRKGQEVEVLLRTGPRDDLGGFKIAWRKAKILTVSRPNEPPQTASVIFSDGTSAVFDEEHIRIDTPRGQTAIHPMETIR